LGFSLQASIQKNALIPGNICKITGLLSPAGWDYVLPEGKKYTGCKWRNRPGIHSRFMLPDF
jgi:hypothetical protein